MVIVGNQLARGDNQYVAALVAFNSIFQILFFSVYAWFFLAFLPPLFGLEGSVIHVSFWTIAEAVLTYLGIPFLAGFLTPRWLVKAKGNDGYATRVLPNLLQMTLVAVRVTIVAIYRLKGNEIGPLQRDLLGSARPLSTQ